MTELTLAKGDYNTKLVAQFSQAITIAFMIVGFMLSLSLLNWAVHNRLGNSATEANSPITAEVRERQLGCLAKNIYHEAGHEPFEGKVAVAQVTMNRVDSGQFPDDVCKVIFQKNIIYEKVICQFSWACDRDVMIRPVNKEAYDESMSVAKKVLLEGFRLPGLTEAMYYHADYINPGWSRPKVTQIGHHIFYK